MIFKDLLIWIGTRCDDQSKLKGCTKKDISDIKNYYNISGFPSHYQVFLTKFGKSEHWMFNNIINNYDNLLYRDTRIVASEILLDVKSPFVLPLNAFVFCVGDLTGFSYFLLNSGNNPAIYSFSADYINPFPEKYYHDFSEYLFDNIARTVGKNNEKITYQINQFLKTFRLAPHILEVRRQIANLSFFTGDFEESYSQCRAILTMDSGNELFLDILNYLCTIKKCAEALHDLESYLQCNPDGPNMEHVRINIKRLREFE